MFIIIALLSYKIVILCEERECIESVLLKKMYKYQKCVCVCVL